MNYNTFLERFGINPNDFKDIETCPVKTDTGFVYYLEQKDGNRQCPNCLSNHVHIKSYYNVKINITLNGNEKDELSIKKIRYMCLRCNSVFTNKIDGVVPYGNVSNIVKNNITLDYYKKRTFQDIANTYSLSKSYIIKLFDDTFPFVPRNELSEVVCIDEFHFSKVYDQNYCCVLCDFNNKKIIDIIKNRQKAYLIEYFDTFSSSELSKVKYYISDMYDEYRNIKKIYFPEAIHIIDLFHIISQLTNAINVIRTKSMKTSFKPHSMEYNFMKKNWKCFLCRSNKIPNKTYTYMKTGECYSYYELVNMCLKEDNNLAIGYGVLQDLFKYYMNKNIFDIKQFIEWISKRLINSGCVELIKVGHTYLKWEEEIANAFLKESRERKLTNATAEGMNSQIKTILKSAYGYNNFERFRKRAMLIYAHQGVKKQ